MLYQLQKVDQVIEYGQLLMSSLKLIWPMHKMTFLNGDP